METTAATSDDVEMADVEMATTVATSDVVVALKSMLRRLVALRANPLVVSDTASLSADLAVLNQHFGSFIEGRTAAEIDATLHSRARALCSDPKTGNGLVRLGDRDGATEWTFLSGSSDTAADDQTRAAYLRALLDRQEPSYKLALCHLTRPSLISRIYKEEYARRGGVTPLTTDEVLQLVHRRISADIALHL